MRFIIAAAIAVFCLFCIVPTHAQRSIASLGSANTENFNSLGNGFADLNVTDNTTILGFYAFRTVANASPNVFSPSPAFSTDGRFFALGGFNSTERTVGTFVSADNGTSYLGMRYSNATGFGSTSVTVAYIGEQWRRGSDGAETLAFSYQVGPAGTMTSLTAGTWTPVAALDFTSPNNTGGLAALSGNVTANRVALTSTFAVNIPAGQEIMLRWEDVDDPDLDHAMGVDDLSVTFATTSAADASITGRVTDANGRAIGSAMILIQDILGQTKKVLTNTFGYYKASGLDTGQTYVVSVSSRRHTFSSPSLVVDLSDNVGDLNFVASR